MHQPESDTHLAFSFCDTACVHAHVCVCVSPICYVSKHRKIILLLGVALVTKCIVSLINVVQVVSFIVRVILTVNTLVIKVGMVYAYQGV